MKNENTEYKNIPGWGMDMDPKNEPTYPIKNYTGDDHMRSNYEKSTLQPIDIELLKSNERPAYSAVFGTSVPPSGLSGMIRRYAFKHSEDRYRHWIPLIIADRVNAFEGILDDLRKGSLPNVFHERGWKSEIKYNAKGLAKKAFIGALISSLLITYMARRK
jgi:hypothetical protein